MNIQNIKKSILIATFAGVVAGCSSGGGTSSPSPAPSASEQGVAVFQSGISIAESPSWVSTSPSTGSWSKYISGTTQPIVAVAANTNNILAFDGASLYLSNASGSQFTPINYSFSALSSPVIVAGSNQFVMYSGSSVWTISDSGAVVQDTLSGLNSAISGMVYLDNTFYAYTQASTVYSSTDGLSWTLVSSAQNIQPFTNVVKLNTGVYAAMTAPQLNTSNANLWLGTSATSFSAANNPLQNFFGAPAQVNFIATDGNNNLFINETIYLTNHTIREYYIANANQVSTNAILQTISLPSSISTAQKPTNLYFTSDTIYLSSGTVEAVNNPSGDLIDPTGPTSLTAVPYVTSPALTSQFVGSSSLTNGSTYAIQGNNLISAPGTYSMPNNGALTVLTNASNVLQPSYNVLPTGESVSYAAVAGNVNQYMLLLNNGGVLLNSGSGYIPTTAITNTSDANGSTAITSVASAGSVNGAYLVQAASSGGGSNGDLYYSQNGTSWTMISQATLTSAGFGTLSSAAVSVNQLNNTFNITTSSGTYQTISPATLTSWAVAPSPTPLFAINGGVYTLYPNSNSLGTLSGNAYTVTANALPQNYVSSGNVAYNGTNTVALAQAATVVAQAGKYAGTNYLWTASNLNSNWTLNFATFADINGQALADEFFNVNPVLIWTGKIWIAEGNGNTLINATNLSSAVYSSNNAIAWQAESASSQAIIGVPFAF